MATEKEFKPDFLPDENFESDIPWLWPEKLDWNVSVRWASAWWWVKALNFSRAASVWTWLQQFTWFGFTPSSYSITAWRQWLSLDITWSIWLYDWTTERTFQMADWESNSFSWGVLRVFHVNQPWWWETEANHNTFISDWIELNFTDSTADVFLMITAYK